MNGEVEETINIVVSADDNYAQHVAVVFASILCNTSAKDRLRFYLLSDGISAAKIEKIRLSLDGTRAQLTVYDLSQTEQFASLYTSGHISRAAYFRLAIADILPREVRKVIYMDVDLLVLRDIEQLWQIDLQGRPLAAVPDYGIMSSARLLRQKQRVIGLPEEMDYFNSGVVIMDLAQWRKQAYSQQVITMAAAGNLPHHDQDALNKVFMDNWCRLPLSWNVIPPVFNLFTKIVFDKKLRTAAITAKKDIGILHYAGRYKPWEFTLHEGFNEKYYQYLKLTGFKEAPMPKPGRNMQGKSITRQMLRLKLAELWLALFG